MERVGENIHSLHSPKKKVAKELFSKGIFKRRFQGYMNTVKSEKDHYTPQMLIWAPSWLNLWSVVTLAQADSHTWNPGYLFLQSHCKPASPNHYSVLVGLKLCQTKVTSLYKLAILYLIHSYIGLYKLVKRKPIGMLLKLPYPSKGFH